MYIIGCQIESDTITLHHVVANWSQSKIAETVVNRHHDFVEKWTLNLAVGGIYNAVPLTKDRRPPCPPLPARRGVLRLLYHHVADHVIVPLGEALAGLGDPKKRQHPLGIRLSLEKLRPNV